MPEFVSRYLQTDLPFRLYYWGTAGFLLLDYFFDVNLRLAFLESNPAWRALYYLFCFACLALIVWRPNWSIWITTLESLITLALLIVFMGVRVMIYQEPAPNGSFKLITPSEIVNFLLAGSAAWLAYWQGASRLRNRGRY